MATTKVKGIVLGGTNYKEKDKLVRLYTLEKGKMIVTMRGVRGDRAKLKFAKEVFCFGEYIIEEGKTNIVTSVDIIDSFYNISQNIDKYYEGCAILDIIDKFSGESNPQLFIEAVKALKSLCYDNLKKYYVIDKFLLDFLNFSGYFFMTEKCSSCGATLSSRYLNLDFGELVCPACKTSTCVQVSEACYGALRILAKTEYEKLSTVKFGGMGEVQAFNLLSRNYEWRTGYSVLSII